MKLNEKELLYIGNKVNGEAHKEGALWIKETEKKLKKKEGTAIAHRLTSKKTYKSEFSLCSVYQTVL